MGVAARATPAGVGAVFTSCRGIRMAIDLAGLAIAGGLFIVPAFAAVQAWAGADRRARVIAAVNVLNAAFMVGGTLVVALLQAAGVTTPMLFLLLGVCQPRCVAVADRPHHAGERAAATSCRSSSARCLPRSR